MEPPPHHTLGESTTRDGAALLSLSTVQVPGAPPELQGALQVSNALVSNGTEMSTVPFPAPRVARPDPAEKACEWQGCGITGWAKRWDARQKYCPSHQREKEARPERHKEKRAKRKELDDEAVHAAARTAPPSVVWDVTGQKQPEAATLEQLNAILAFCITTHNKQDEGKRNGVMELQGGLLEVFVPAEDEDAMPNDVRDFGCWHAIEAGKRPLWRGTAPTEAVAYIKEAIEGTRLAFQRYYGATPFVHHDFGLIMGDLEEGKGDEEGQPIHCDVDSPEAFAVTYLLPGIATTAANYTSDEASKFVREFGKRTGYTQEYLTMHPAKQSLLYSSFMSTSLLAAPDLFDRCPKSDGTQIKPPCSVNIVRGGWPHGAHGLTKSCPRRLILFSAATPLRTAVPYSGYEQKLVGELEIFWACCAKEQHMRDDFERHALLAVKCNKAYYKTYFKNRVYNAPIAKVMLAIAQAQGDSLKMKRERGLEVGFTAEELQRIVLTLDKLLHNVCSEGGHALGWRVTDVGQIMHDLKELIHVTKKAEKQESAFEAFMKKEEEEEMKTKGKGEKKGKKAK